MIVLERIGKKNWKADGGLAAGSVKIVTICDGCIRSKINTNSGKIGPAIMAQDWN